METLVLLIFGALISGLVGIASNEIDSQNQRLEAARSDKRYLDMQKELERYKVELQQENNTIATQKGHAAQAGYNPALLYSGSLPALSDTGGVSAQGTMPNLPKLSDTFASKLTPSTLAEKYLTDRDIRTREQDANTRSQVGNSEFIKNMSIAAENMRNTKFQKRMENVIYSKGMAELDIMNAQKHGIDIQNVRSQLMLPIELEQQGLINEQIATQIKDTTERMKNYPVERAKMRAEMKEINSIIERNNHLNKLTDEDLRYTQERFRGSAVERIVKEYGLTNRMLPAWLRKDQIENYYLRQPQLIGATAQLVSLGFSQEEAVQTVLWYTATESKDVGPSTVNAISRGLSALILRKGK